MLNPPNSIAALGDSITSGTGAAAGVPGQVQRANSWSTGTASGINSLYQRLLAINPAISGNNHDQSDNGRRMGDMVSQANAMPTTVRLVTVQLGGNDLCRSTVAQMPSAAEYRAWFVAGLNAIEARSPNAITMVSSVPDIWNLWFLRGAPNPPNSQPSSRATVARTLWTNFISPFPCQSLLASPTNMGAEHVARRAAVRQRTIEYNQVLAEECAKRLRCRTDNMLTFGFSSNRVDPFTDSNFKPRDEWDFVDDDISTLDHFHPSSSGQTKLAQASWESGYDYTEATPPNLSSSAVSPEPPVGGVSSVPVDVEVTWADSAGVKGIEYRVHHGDDVTPWSTDLSEVDDSGQVWEFPGSYSVSVPVDEIGVSYIETRAMDGNGNLSASQFQEVEYDPSSSEPFLLELNHGVVSLGSAATDSAVAGTVTLEGTLSADTGQVTVPSENISDITAALPGVDGSVTFRPNGTHLAGELTPNGKLVIRGPFRANFVIGDLACHATANLRFASDRTVPYRGTRFASGLEGQGAIVAAWDGLSNIRGDAGCAAQNATLNTPGGIWLSHDIASPFPPAPVGPLELTPPTLIDSSGELATQITPGRRLICVAGTWSNVTRGTFAWTKNDAPFSNLKADGAGSDVYRPTAGEIGSTFSCHQVMRNAQVTGVVGTSSNTAVVVAN